MSESFNNQDIPDDFARVFSKKLRHFINVKQKTQEEVASAIGVSGATVSFWCKGQRIPRMDKIDKLCHLFGCSRDDLLTDESKPKEITPMIDMTTEDALLIEWYHGTGEHNRDLIRRMMAYENALKKDTTDEAM
jgi:transcriptional regulator with XRE-family HTH domain